MVALTIVARSPESHQAWDDLTVPPGGEDDLPTQELMDKLRARTDKSSHIVARASSIQDIRNILAQVTPRPELIQIAGHGLVGALELGGMWIHKLGLRPEKNKTYALDDNPNNYGILAGLVAPSAHVLLLGCRVGTPSSAPTQINDGPTFVFRLARLWRSNVSAPSEFFTTDSYNNAGLFVDTHSMLVTASGLTVTMPTKPSSPATPALAQPNQFSEQVHFERLIAAPALRYSLNASAQREPAIHEPLTLTSLARAPMKGVFAAAELIFEATWGGGKWIGEVLGHGALVRMRQGNTTEHLVPDHDTRERIRAIVHQLSGSTHYY